MTTWKPMHWATFIAIIALGALHVLYYRPFVADDSYISLRYAARFLQGKGLTWNDGEYVEGYSNLLWVLLTAGLGYIGFALEYAPTALGIASLILTVPAIFFHARDAKLPPWITITGIALFLASPPVAIWTNGGLETPMVMLCYSWAMVLSYRLIDRYDPKSSALAGICLALMCWLRPEGLSYTGALALSILLFSSLPVRQRITILIPFCAIPLAAYLAQLGFRLHYYHQFVPNTVLAKVTFNALRLRYGAIYVAKGWFAVLPLLIYAVLNLTSKIPAGLRGKTTRYIGMLVSVFIIISILLIIGGGDTFMAFRAFVPLWMIIVLVTMYALYAGLQKNTLKKEWMFFGYVFVCFVGLQFYLPENYHRGEVTWITHAKELGLMLKQRYGDRQPLVAVDAAGAIPYFSELPSLDVFGLTDGVITHRREQTPHFGKMVMGYELFDIDYILQRKPDIFATEVPGKPFCFDVKEENVLQYSEECKKILQYYRQETVEFLDGSTSILLLRKDSAKVNP